MAVTLGKNCYIADAQGDQVGPEVNIATTLFRVVTGANSGQCIVLDDLGGREIFRSRALNANDVDEGLIVSWIDGFYVSSLPTGAKLYIYYR